MNYTVDVLLSNGNTLNFTDVEAANEKEAIQQVSEVEENFVLFKQDGTYYKIKENQIIGYKVTSSSGPDEDDPVKQAIN